MSAGDQRSWDRGKARDLYFANIDSEVEAFDLECTPEFLGERGSSIPFFTFRIHTSCSVVGITATIYDTILCPLSPCNCSSLLLQATASQNDIPCCLAHYKE
jgi:hypothetical protein